MQIRRISYQDVKDLLAKVDKTVDTAKKAAAYRKAFRHLDLIWSELRDWILSYLNG